MFDKSLLENNHKTRYITSLNAGTPNLENNFGSLVNLLNVILCEGVNPQIASSIIIENTHEMIINLPVNHSFILHQLITIEGATQTECNGNFRIKEVNKNSVKVNLKTNVNFTEVTTSTSFKIKTASLGFSRLYKSTDNSTMCFKNGSVQSPVILKVIDKIPPNGYTSTWSKFARVVIGTEIDSNGNFINNNKMPFLSDWPDVENTGNKVSGSSGIHGYAKWDYASIESYHRENYTPSNPFPRKWSIIGDNLSFYLIIDSFGDGYPTILGFGNFEAYNKNESYNSFLQARGGFESSQSTSEQGYSRTRNYFGAIGASSDTKMHGNFLLANAYGGGAFTNLRYRTGGLYIGNTTVPHRSGFIKNYNPQSGRMITSGLLIIDEDTNIIRGLHRGIKTFYGRPNVALNRITQEGFIILEVNDFSNSRTNMPYLFSLLDWEV